MDDDRDKIIIVDAATVTLGPSLGHLAAAIAEIVGPDMVVRVGDALTYADVKTGPEPLSREDVRKLIAEPMAGYMFPKLYRAPRVKDWEQRNRGRAKKR